MRNSLRVADAFPGRQQRQEAITAFTIMLRKKIGDFYLAKRMGLGGKPDVYLGINPRSREKRVFKICAQRTPINSFECGHFIRQVDVIRDLSHPGIVKIIDSGILENGYYYSMEFMPGGNLAQCLERGKIPLDAALDLFTLICDAIAYVHEQGLSHRDLKPSNILINASGEPVISDFGIEPTAEAKSNGNSQSGDLLGTIAYCAPEQRFSSKTANRRTDVFALGAILYHMLMGFPPLGKYPWPKEVQPDFPEYLQSILEKCLASDPDKRFEHAGLVLAQLKKWPEHPASRKQETPTPLTMRQFVSGDNGTAQAARTDRIEAWFRVLRAGTARERLAVVREMAERLTPAEAKTIVKLYAEEEERVRWGLIRVLGELKIEAATALILSDMNNSFYAECAIEALGKIGSAEAFNPIRSFAAEHPESAAIALLPMARTGKKRAIKTLEQYLSHQAAALRKAAVRALASIECSESLVLLREHLCAERDETVRAVLIQAVHELQRELSPVLKAGIHDSADAVRSSAAIA